MIELSEQTPQAPEHTVKTENTDFLKDLLYIRYIMCEVAPGPRCSFDMSQKLKARIKTYNKALNSSPVDETQLRLLKAKVSVAQQEYNSTPAGLEELQAAITANPDDENLKTKYLISSHIRKQQTVALNEIKNERVQNISEIYAQNNQDFDADQIASLLETLREEEEHEVLKTISETGNPVDDKADQSNYAAFLAHLSKTNPQAVTQLKALATLPAPDETNLKAYEKLEAHLSKSKQYLNHQIKEIAYLQNTTPAVAEAHYMAYRNQYLTEYAPLPSSQQPNPPANWIKGEFANSGFSQSPTSKYAPHDKASMYAIHRLRSDDNAIPDYMKQTKQYVQIAEVMNGVIVNTYSPGGKKISEKLLPSNAHQSLIRHELEGKILFQSPAQTLNHYSLRPMLNSNDYVSKHFDFPSYKSTELTGLLSAERGNPVDIFFAAKRKVRKIWNSKPARAEAPQVRVDVFSIKS